MPAWGDFGMGLSEEERRRAMREAIFRAGIGITQRAGTEGFGAFAGLPGQIGAGLYDAGAGIVSQRAAQAKAAEAARQQALDDEAQQLLIQKRRRELVGADAENDEKAREIERRKAAVASVSDPKLKAELELRIGQTNFWSVLDKKQAPPKDPAAPTTKRFADNTTRMWNPKTSSWDVVARRPEKEAGGDGDFGKVIAAGDKAVVAGRTKALARADLEISEIRKENEKKLAPPVPLPNRFELAKRYELEELEGARYAAGLPSTKERPSFARSAPAPGGKALEGPTSRAAAPTADVGELEAAVAARVSALKLPPELSTTRRAQILARARRALEDGVSLADILNDLR